MLEPPPRRSAAEIDASCRARLTAQLRREFPDEDASDRERLLCELLRVSHAQHDALIKGIRGEVRRARVALERAEKALKRKETSRRIITEVIAEEIMHIPKSRFA